MSNGEIVTSLIVVAIVSIGLGITFGALGESSITDEVRAEAIERGYAIYNSEKEFEWLTEEQIND